MFHLDPASSVVVTHSDLSGNTEKDHEISYSV
jgi:hypothetical protein